MEGLFNARNGFEKKEQTANIVEMGPFPKVAKITFLDILQRG